MAVIVSRRSSYCPNFATALIRGIDLDGIIQGAHPDLTLLKVMDQVECVTDGAAQPVEGVDDDDISRAGLLESGPIRGGSGFLVDVDVFIRNTFFAERVDLTVGVLFCGGNPGVTNIHDPQRAGSLFCSRFRESIRWNSLWNSPLLGLCIFNWFP
ncbi:hypothetical protein CEPID_00265 [Corynebacterium epidermidicanis]|uniref:Uncharacterized protein n=1 Tax=Corynebacterium epidermidicanis TaxID=1050174 RepID=A0A0G3GSV6_9CORY|nr:hypothetical protein CEPID_00265 [Corynebacterium epidermidicanis]